MTNQVLLVDGLNCSGCVNTLTKRLMDVPGVSDVRVDLVPGATSTVHITADQTVDTDSLEASVIAAGKRITQGVPA